MQSLSCDREVMSGRTECSVLRLTGGSRVCFHDVRESTAPFACLHQTSHYIGRKKLTYLIKPLLVRLSITCTKDVFKQYGPFQKEFTDTQQESLIVL